MISSEVQRTLVKSRPELWAELSDQATLARHLGELGEIRITRVEPEQAVEWEAENISGTVRLKPSGWGTKVTLTVTREIPDPTVEATPESLADAEPAMQGEPAMHEATARVDFESTMQAAFEPAAHVEAESGAQTEPDLPMHLAAEPLAQVGPEPPIHLEAEAVPEVEPEPPMHVEAEPEAHVDPEPAFVLEIEHQQAIVEEPVEAFDPGPARQTRRSLFSRLFRRRPRAEAVEPEPYEPNTIVEEPWLSGWPEPLTIVDPSLEPAENGEDPYATIEPTPETLDPGEPLMAEEPAATDERVIAEIEGWVAMEEPPAAQAPVSVETGELPTAETQEPLEGAAGEPADLSAELRAAEQVAAEQVAMVLTAVLDRLGAAHHRPFSRA
jgi:hypothetical protein